MGKETAVESRTGAQQGRDRRSQARPDLSLTVPPSGSEEMSERQRQVLECLGKAGNGLTAKQIQARVSCAPCAADEVLAELVDMRLVVRLNTLVPSFALRHSSTPPHAE